MNGSAIDMGMPYVAVLRTGGPPNTTREGSLQQTQLQLLLALEMLDQSPVIDSDVEAALMHVMAAAGHLRSLRAHVSAQPRGAPPSSPSRPLGLANDSAPHASPHAAAMPDEEALS